MEKRESIETCLVSLAKEATSMHDVLALETLLMNVETVLITKRRALMKQPHLLSPKYPS